MDKRFWAIIGVIVIIFGGLMFYSSHKKDSANSSKSAASTSATNHVKGNLNSNVTLLEYGDYQCPACESFNPTVDAVFEKYQDKIKFQFRNLPLTQIHQNAFAAARAAEAADLQGKFWEMHDALYLQSNWAQWTQAKDPKPYFWGYAKSLNLDEAKFKADFASETVNKRINADIAAFDATGEQKSTPTFFINGTVIKNSDLLDSNNQPSVEKFSAVIDAALAKNQ